MDWDKLRIFHSVAEAGSFTHAGTDLGLSQSAVSRQISSLESDLKVPLFHRHARGLILTEQGEMLYRTAHDVFSKLALAQTRLQDSKDKPFGELTITTTVGLGANWLTPRITEFIELYPDIKVYLVIEDKELDLSMREADVALRLRQPVQPDLIQRKLFTVHNHIYASAEYLRKNGTPQEPEELRDHKILSFGPRTMSYLKEINWIETLGCKDGEKHEPVLMVNSVYGLRRAAENGLGIAALPDYIVGENSNLVRILHDVEAPEFETYFVYPEELKSSKRVAVFRDFIVAKAKEWSF